MIPKFELFNPKGLIAEQQSELIITVVALMMIAVVPFLIFTFYFAWKYRASANAKYAPKVESNSRLQFGWLGLLVVIVFVIANLAWKGAHALDPRKPLESNKQPITIQVVALEWKWLFLYPDQGVASVNFFQFPQNTPINLQLTADAPMNSFLIPQLGGQMYAMNGMKTTLHLMANEIGEYRGFSSNISGEGFAGMRFIAKASSEQDFNAWVQTAKLSANLEYENLAEPTKNLQPTTYNLGQHDLFDSIVMKYMTPQEHTHVR